MDILAWQFLESENPSNKGSDNCPIGVRISSPEHSIIHNLFEYIACQLLLTGMLFDDIPEKTEGNSVGNFGPTNFLSGVHLLSIEDNLLPVPSIAFSVCPLLVDLFKIIEFNATDYRGENIHELLTTFMALGIGMGYIGIRKDKFPNKIHFWDFVFSKKRFEDCQGENSHQVSIANTGLILHFHIGSALIKNISYLDNRTLFPCHIF